MKRRSERDNLKDRLSRKGSQINLVFFMVRDPRGKEVVALRAREISFLRTILVISKFTLLVFAMCIMVSNFFSVAEGRVKLTLDNESWNEKLPACRRRGEGEK